MSTSTIDPGPGNGGPFRINQGINDLKEGLQRGGDYSRISLYRGANDGLHTGHNSDTLGRHGQPFGQAK